MIEIKRYNIYKIHIDDQRILVYILNIDMSLYLTQDSSQSKIRGWDNLYKIYTLYEFNILHTMLTKKVHGCLPGIKNEHLL